MNERQATMIVTSIVVLIVLFALTIRCLFVVRVDQFAIVTQFGDPVQTVTEPGLNFLIPFVQQVHYLDSRVRGWDDTARDTKTGETHPIDYTVFARWRIADPLQYYKAVGEEKRAHAAMDSIITNQIQQAVKRRKVASIVRETGRTFQAREAVDLRSVFKEYEVCDPELNPEFGLKTAQLDETTTASKKPRKDDVQALRSKIVSGILLAANSKLEEFGIIIEDLHFKYLNYSPQVHGVIIRKIQADRQKDIASYIEVGKQCVGYIKGLTDTERGQIVAQAEEEVRRIDGKAIAKAIEIKSQAFGKNPGFFEFLKSLEVYETSLSRKTRMVLSMDNPLLKLMKSKPAVPAALPVTAPPKTPAPAP